MIMCAVKNVCVDDAAPLGTLLLWTVLVVSDEEPLGILSLTIRHGTPVQHHYGGQPEGRCSSRVLKVLTEYFDDEVTEQTSAQLQTYCAKRRLRLSSVL